MPRQHELIKYEPIKYEPIKYEPIKYEPMLMHAADKSFSRKGWIFEPKLDGMRGIAVLRGQDVAIYSRGGLEYSTKYRALAADLRALNSNMVLDGEIVAIDLEGRPSFERLQQRIRMREHNDIAAADSTNPLFYYVFDILEINGSSLLHVPLKDRKTVLLGAFENTALIKHVAFVEEDGETLFAAACNNGLEGVVGKNAESRYLCGRRSKNWIKVKSTITADVVIAGHCKDVGYLVGRFEDDGIRYVGSVATGLRAAEHEYLATHLQRRSSCPFRTPYGRGDAIWFEPVIFAEVKFMHWTSGGLLRVPSFTRLRLV